MEKKYPVIKCDEELWNEIKPVLKSFDIDNFHIYHDALNQKNNYIVSNYGNSNVNELIIGNTIYNNDKEATVNYRYLVDTKEEFLSAVAKLLGKEYPSKEQIVDTKYPYIKCTQQLYDKIKDILKVVGYEERNTDAITFDFVHNPYLVIDYLDVFGDISNIKDITKPTDSRYECSDIREFLTKVCELKGFEVSYVDFVGDDDAENHYFKYVLDKDNNLITIHETKEDKSECSAAVTREKQRKKKNKIENYVVSYNPATGESSTVVANMPVKGNDFDKDKGSDLDIDKPMEKINIADKLRHCKQGTKLYHLMFGEVEFDSLDEDDYINIITKDKENNFSDYIVNQFGQYCSSYPNGECLLFPSKDNRDWNNFQVLEKGHRVMVSDDCIDWKLREFIGEIYASPINGHGTNNWNFIVPVEDFDFLAKDITINKEKSIV